VAALFAMQSAVIAAAIPSVHLSVYPTRKVSASLSLPLSMFLIITRCYCYSNSFRMFLTGHYCYLYQYCVLLHILIIVQCAHHSSHLV